MVNESKLGNSEGESLHIRDVRKVFGGHDRTGMVALDHATFSLEAGTLLSLVGPSGCGKSTLLRLIAGLDQPTSGELWMGDERITKPGAERGLMFQEHNLFPWLTVRRNVQAGLVARGVPRRQYHEAEELIHLVGLEAFADAYPYQLSGGMAQRAALARALVNHPRILLLDEPLGALDQFTRMRMQDEILRVWKDRGTTMVLVTHDVDEAIYLSDQIAILTPRPGRIDRILEVSLPRPRQRNHPDFLALRVQLLEMLHLTGKSDALTS